MATILRLIVADFWNIVAVVLFVSQLIVLLAFLCFYSDISVTTCCCYFKIAAEADDLI